MTFLPLDQIRLDAQSHTSALHWIGLLYRRPRKVKEAGKGWSRWLRAACVLRLYLHALPYLFLATAMGRWLLFGVLGLKGDPKAALVPGHIQGLEFHGLFLVAGLVLLAMGLVIGLIVALAFGLASGLASGLTSSAVFGLVVIAGGLGDKFARGLTCGLALGLAFALLHSCLDGRSAHPFSVPIGRHYLGLASSLGGGLYFSLSNAFDSHLANLAGSLAFVPTYVIVFYRLYYLPFHWLWPRSRGELYRLHPVAWDDICLLSFPGLDNLLIAFADYAPKAGEDEIDRLIDEYPSQRRGALRARAILVARRAAATGDLSRLDESLVSLPEGKKGFLAETADLRSRVHEISALQGRLDTLDRPFLREPFAALLVKEIETFEQKIAGFKPPLATEFRKAARQWLVIARHQLDAARAAVTREPTHQVFRAGDPVDREREAFVMRGSILGEVERQVMLATGCPGLLVYGRRRMGKSTLLRNLEGLLPPRVHVVNLSMQEARAFTSLADLVRLIGQRVTAVVPGSTEPAADLKGLQTFVDNIQKLLEASDRRLLLAIDEYENLDSKIGEGVLPEDLLAVLRESIQTHRRIIWTFAGSHGIDELTHAPWSSYLVSARTIEVTPFEPAETRLLLTEPLKHSSLWRAAETERPRFEPGFWGDGGIEQIHAEAGGWPHLVQLVAETVVDLVNDSGGASMDGALLERALDRAVVRGNNVLLELMERESRLPGEWEYLRAFRQLEEQPIPADEALDRSLRRRRLIVEEGGQYRLRVPLMARWLRQRI